MPLYHGEPNNSIKFEKPGVVTLGCNIHDKMLGYIYIVETPYFSKTDALGRTIINSLPYGEYEVDIWHPKIVRQDNKNNKEIIDISNSPYKIQKKILIHSESMNTRILTPLEKKFKAIK